MSVPNSDTPAAGTQQAIDLALAEAERVRAFMAAATARIRQLEESARQLEARVRQLEEHAVEGTTTAQNYGGPSVA
jgi:hypothetical protein